MAENVDRKMLCIIVAISNMIRKLTIASGVVVERG